MLTGDGLDEITAQARALVAAGRGRALMLVPGWWYVISAESFLGRMTEMPDVLELAPTIHCPRLFICGDEESPVRPATPGRPIAMAKRCRAVASDPAARSGAGGVGIPSC
jgi:hypothetical protein